MANVEGEAIGHQAPVYYNDDFLPPDSIITQVIYALRTQAYEQLQTTTTLSIGDLVTALYPETCGLCPKFRPLLSLTLETIIGSIADITNALPGQVVLRDHGGAPGKLLEAGNWTISRDCIFFPILADIINKPGKTLSSQVMECLLAAPNEDLKAVGITASDLPTIQKNLLASLSTFFSESKEATLSSDPDQRKFEIHLPLHDGLQYWAPRTVDLELKTETSETVGLGQFPPHAQLNDFVVQVAIRTDIRPGLTHLLITAGVTDNGPDQLTHLAADSLQLFLSAQDPALASLDTRTGRNASSAQNGRVISYARTSDGQIIADCPSLLNPYIFPDVLPEILKMDTVWRETRRLAAVTPPQDPNYQPAIVFPKDWIHRMVDVGKPLTAACIADLCLSLLLSPKITITLLDELANYYPKLEQVLTTYHKIVSRKKEETDKFYDGAYHDVLLPTINGDELSYLLEERRSSYPFFMLSTIALMHDQEQNPNPNMCDTMTAFCSLFTQETS